MKQYMKIIFCSVAFATASVPVSAETPFEDEIKARQGYFQVIKYNFGILAEMVKGKQEYDAATANIAAQNIYNLSLLDNGALWPPGSDNSKLDNTKAKPEIWEKYPDIAEKGDNWAAAVKVLAGEASNGLDALKGSFGPVGKACKACHDDYKAK